jgi:hypothetical protein
VRPSLFGSTRDKILVAAAVSITLFPVVAVIGAFLPWLLICSGCGAAIVTAMKTLRHLQKEAQ